MDGAAQAFYGFGQTSYQSARVDGRHVSVEPTADHVGGVADRTGLVAVHPLNVVVGQPEGVPGPHAGADPFGLGATASHVDPATLRIVAVNALGLGHPADVVDGVVKATHLADRGLRGGSGGPVHGANAVLAEGPASVSSRGAKSGDLAFHDHDA